MANKLALIGDLIARPILDRAAKDFTLNSIEAYLGSLGITAVRETCAVSPEDTALLDDTVTLLLTIKKLLPLMSDYGSPTALLFYRTIADGLLPIDQLMERRRLRSIASETAHAVDLLNCRSADAPLIEAAVKKVTGEPYKFNMRDFLRFRGA